MSDKRRLNYLTTNKSNRDINKQFDQKNFNKNFEKKKTEFKINN